MFNIIRSFHGMIVYTVPDTYKRKPFSARTVIPMQTIPRDVREHHIEDCARTLDIVSLVDND